MKKYIVKFTLFSLFIITFSSLFGQFRIDSTKISKINQVPIENNVTLYASDTIMLKQISSDIKKKSFFYENISWMTAIIIAFISIIGNLIISKRQEKKATQNLTTQLKNNETILNKQIENSKELALTQYKATIAANNRQNWINELRETVSDFLTVSLSLTPDSSTVDNIDLKYDKLFYTKFKIDLLLNVENEEHRLLQKALNKLIDVIKDSDNYNIEKLQKIRDICLEATRRVINTEWKKIKELK